MKTFKVNIGHKWFSIKVEGEPHTKGGEGGIWHLRHSVYGDCAMKIFRTADKANKKKDKVLYLITQEPPQTANPDIKFCWPFGAVYDEKSNQFCGYLMQYAFPGSRDLSILSSCTGSVSMSEMYPDDRAWHNHFNFNTKEGLIRRCKILFNWITAINLLHKTGQYIIGDIKCENVLATPSGKISIIDLDSCQIVVSNQNKVFPCSSKTPNYFAPECYAQVKNQLPLDYNCDSFAIGCCIYQILVGCHPYGNSILLPPFDDDKYCSLQQKIKHNLYYNGINSSYVRVPEQLNIHSNRNRLNMEICRLFDRTFCMSSKRPTMNEWRSALLTFIKG